MTRVDLHLHSRASTDTGNWFLRQAALPESYTSPAAAYAAAKRRGMDFVTISDHNTLAGVLEIAHHPDAFVSVEATTRFPEDGTPLHVLVWGLGEAQWDELDRVRDNVYDLVALLEARGLARALPRVAGRAQAASERRTPRVDARAAIGLLEPAPVVRLDLHPADLADDRLAAAALWAVRELVGRSRRPSTHAELLPGGWPGAIALDTDRVGMPGLTAPIVTAGGNGPGGASGGGARRPAAPVPAGTGRPSSARRAVGTRVPPTRPRARAGSSGAPARPAPPPARPGRAPRGGSRRRATSARG
jgi:hypothetical protein